MMVKIEESWRQRLQEEFDKPYFEQLVTFVKNEYRRVHVLPPGHQIFHIFNACPFEKVKVVILGQDPYPNPGPVLRSLLLSPARSTHSGIAGQHIQGNTPGLR